MTIAYIDVAKAPVQVPVIDLLQEPQGAAFDFISGKAWIVDKVNPANTMLRNIGDVLTNPGASPTKLLRRKSGLLESAPWWANEYDLTGNPMGMRVEAQRTNLIPWSGDFTKSAWAKTQINVVADDGSHLLIPSEGGSGHFLRQGAITVTPNTAYALTTRVKKAGYRYFYCAQLGGPTSGRIFDFDTGTYTNTSTGTGAYTAELEPDGFWKLTSVFTTGPSAATVTMELSAQPINSFSSFAADGVSGVRIKNIQLEAGAFATSDIPTGAAAVTRAADQPQIPTGFLPYNPAEGTLILDGMIYGIDSGGFDYVATVGGSQQNNQAVIMSRSEGAGNQNLYCGINNAQPYNNHGVLTFPGNPDPKKIAFSWDADAVASVSGVNATPIEAARVNKVPLPSGTLTLRPGSGIMWYRSAIYIPRKLTAAELLQRVSA